MNRSGKNPGDQAFLKEVGRRVALVIEEKGFKSPYDFWIQKCEGEISRTSLSYIISGGTDVKLTTIKAVAKLLNVPISKLIP